jgi:hypothetical protein
VFQTLNRLFPSHEAYTAFSRERNKKRELQASLYREQRGVVPQKCLQFPVVVFTSVLAGVVMMQQQACLKLNNHKFAVFVGIAPPFWFYHTFFYSCFSNQSEFLKKSISLGLISFCESEKDKWRPSLK